MRTLLLIFLISTPALADHVVALTILAEARGEGREGMELVAGCILQRSIDRNLTMRQVCLQRLQFSCWNGKSYEDLAPLLQTPQAKYAIWLEENPHRLNLEAMGGINHYHATWMKKKPYWAKGRKPLIKYKRHVFYRL
jgi:hypothetical protein